ncbi:SLC13 family permease [Raoultibacter phocaeensis]|uniref:SLC13 family permease n=1 Tax=Raoultibacter phocaeensis TaxID=2479841 RepID=UPI00111A59EA|nr:SLC13 family permease [Raoultibacter phocaeensis]
MLDKLITFFRTEAVLCIAAVCALASMAFVPPDASYATYIDTRVLILLFSLMAAVSGLKECGLFSILAQKLLESKRPMRLIALTLVMLPFFSSMLVTNDVALIAFVPFAVLVLAHAGQTRHLAWVIVLQTIAANLGGMVTPIGNPQNLYLFTYYSITFGDFLRALLPFGVLSLVVLAAASMATGGGSTDVSLPLSLSRGGTKRIALHGILFALSLLAVLRVVEPIVLLAVVVCALALFDRTVFRRVDYGLLLTFVCFFVFAGNMGRIEAVRELLEACMGTHPLITSVAASQVISNVPAAVLLSGFTETWQSLLIGVDLGGLGTPIASLASLISLRIYLHVDGARIGRFMLVFGAANAVMLALLLGLYAILYVV